MRKKVITYGLIVIIIILGAFFIINKKNDKRIVVKTERAAMGDIKAYLSTTGTVKSKSVNEYYGPQARVKKIIARVGSKVRAGQPLITYDVTELMNAVKQAQIQYSNAVLQREELRNQDKSIKNKLSELDREINSLEAGTSIESKGSAEALKQQRNSLVPISSERLKLADNTVDLAKLALDSAKQRIPENRGTLYARASGVVTTINAVEGTIGNGMQPAIEVQDVENLNIQVALGKYDAGRVKEGQTVIIKNGGKSFRGVVSTIDPIAKKAIPQGGTDAALSVLVDVLDKSTGLRVDFDVDVDILTAQVENVIKVPAECLRIEKGNINLAFVLKNNLVEERSVKIGLRSDTDVEVIEGIKAGEAVILNPSLSVENGIRAKEDKNAGGK